MMTKCVFCDNEFEPKGREIGCPNCIEYICMNCIYVKNGGWQPDNMYLICGNKRTVGVNKETFDKRLEKGELSSIYIPLSEDNEKVVDWQDSCILFIHKDFLNRRYDDMGIVFLAVEIHNWYLDVVKLLNPESYNKEAEKEFAELTNEQRTIDLIIAERLCRKYGIRHKVD